MNYCRSFGRGVFQRHKGPGCPGKLSQLLCALAMRPLILAASAFAACAFGHPQKHPCHCLTDAETSDLINGFKIVAAIAPGYEAVAQQIIAEDFVSISDGVNFVDGIPVSHFTQMEESHRHRVLTCHSSTPR